MTLFSITTKNIKRNFYHYFIYFASIVFNVMIYYTFVSMRYNNQVARFVEGDEKILVLFNFASIVIAIFSLIFISYSTSFFMKKRKKEMALYSLLGVKKKQIGSMLFYENLVMGILALFIGTILGSILCKFFIMILAKFMGIFGAVDFSINLKALFSTILVFGLLFFVTSIHGYRIIYKYKLVELFKAEKIGEKEPKTSMFLSILSIIILIAGYGIGLRTEASSASFLMNIPITLVASIVGTFIFFYFFLILAVKGSKNNKRKYYKGINMISTSNLLYRVKSNALTFSIIAILSASTLTAIGTCYSFYYDFNNMFDTMYPFSYSYITNDKSIDEKVEKIISKYPENKILNTAQVEFIEINGKFINKNNTLKDQKSKTIYLVSKSKYNKLAQIKGLDIEASLKNEREIILLDHPRTKSQIAKAKKMIGQTIEISLNNEKEQLKIKEYFKYPTMNDRYGQTTFVVDDTIYEKYYIKNHIIREKGYIIDNKNNSHALTKELIRSLPNEVDLMAYYADTQGILKFMGMILFVGIFLGLVFLIATGSIIYFKQLTEAHENRQKYTILKKIGVHKKEIKRSIAKQVLMIFLAPLAIGISHSIVALLILGRLFNTTLWIPTLLTILPYTMIYFVYYILTVNSYNKIANL
ncbi:ABC transporter permease [Crassaminicella profunda]|uniref:ABC transporter permease n=1 Tax=Crassaminicella profunda TaxID=1286698 RepID=UPI001CA69DC1|nr:ABC transporter permease [Crassaminicella profunda]QZY55202.1 ABC transporter permease [Crassaminicella profunda]